MTDAALHRWTASDGVELAYYETGEGRPVILLHGLFSSAQMNWIKFGHAARIASEGFRVITPDLRAHGESGKPHDPAKYSADILVRDLKELIADLKLEYGHEREANESRPADVRSQATAESPVPRGRGFAPTARGCTRC